MALLSIQTHQNIHTSQIHHAEFYAMASFSFLGQKLALFPHDQQVWHQLMCTHPLNEAFQRGQCLILQVGGVSLHDPGARDESSFEGPELIGKRQIHMGAMCLPVKDGSC